MNVVTWLPNTSKKILCSNIEIIPGKTPCWPFNLPVHQSSALAVFTTISIRSPALNDKSPSACASKSYNATTYTAGGAAGFGLGLRGGGGGGALLVAELEPPLLKLYGGGAPWGAPPSDGGGGGGFLENPEAFELALYGEVREVEDDDVAAEAERPRDDPPPAVRLACTTLAEDRM